MHVDIQPFAEYAVAPYVGAWIETSDNWIPSLLRRSHPTWVRGLKLSAQLFVERNKLSHPTWVRGLKLAFCSSVSCGLQVAPYVGAWIETGLKSRQLGSSKSHPTWVRGLKLRNAQYRYVAIASRTLRGCVD